MTTETEAKKSMGPAAKNHGKRLFGSCHPFWSHRKLKR
jgi:hypothetical protein